MEPQRTQSDAECVIPSVLTVIPSEARDLLFLAALVKADPNLIWSRTRCSRVLPLLALDKADPSSLCSSG